MFQAHFLDKASFRRKLALGIMGTVAVALLLQLAAFLAFQSLTGMKARVWFGLAAGLVLTLLITGMARAFARRLGRSVTEPLRCLAEAASRVGEGEIGQRVLNTRQDEVGTLVTAFNHMLDHLGERQASLEEAQRMAHLGRWSAFSWADRVEFSEEICILLGLEEAIHRLSIREFWALVHPEDMALVARVARKAKRKCQAFSLDYRINRPDGTIRWLHVSGAAFLDDTKRSHLRGTAMDITERKHSESGIRQVQKLESLGVLAGGIAHDFNNLLGALMGNLGLASLALPEDSSAGPYISRSEAITQKAANLTRQMLAYSGKGRFEQQLLSLGPVVQELGTLLGVSISKKAELRYELDPAAPPILADLSQIQQVVMNLVTNASEALAEGGGTIALRTGVKRLGAGDLAPFHLSPTLSEGLYALLEVQDSGCGMDAVTLECIFDPFFTTKFSGRGLGLAAMLGIVKGHKGGIRVQSSLGGGTTFTLVFPAAQGTPDPRAPVPAPEEESRYSGFALVVDDEAEVRTMAGSILERMGFQVLLAVDGQEGLDRFREHRGKLELVLLDLTMPRMDGLTCFQEMFLLDPTVPVILSSGFNEREIRHTFAGKQLHYFLQKPYPVTALAAKVRQALGREAVVN